MHTLHLLCDLKIQLRKQKLKAPLETTDSELRENAIANPGYTTIMGCLDEDVKKKIQTNSVRTRVHGNGNKQKDQETALTNTAEAVNSNAEHIQKDTEEVSKLEGNSGVEKEEKLSPSIDVNKGGYS